MNQYRLRWQTGVGAGLLFVLLMTIFFPGMSISATKYIDTAVYANRYAVDLGIKSDEAENILNNYQGTSAKRSGLEKEYEKQIWEKTRGDTSISRLFLAKWALRAEEHLTFDGVHLKEKQSLKNTEFTYGLRLWGWLIYLPFLSALFTFVFVVVKGRTYAGVLLGNGIVTLICEGLEHFMIPSILWDFGGYAVQSFELVNEELLKHSDTGKVFLKTLFSECGGGTWLVLVFLSIVMIIYSILCMTVWREKEVSTEGELSQDGLDIWRERQRTAIQKSGECKGICGEYMGQSIRIQPGEEIVLGRDPQYCMLIFQNPKVSRRHCAIRYDAVNNYYQVIDYSSGGTMLPGGVMLQTSKYTSLLPGTVISIADGSEVFMLM